MGKRPAPVTALCCPNGMLCVFDRNGQQIPFYQGYTVEKQALLAAVLDPEKWEHYDCIHRRSAIAEAQ